MKLITADIDLPDGKSDLIVFDATLKGFGLRVRRLSGGRIGKAWIVQYRQGGHGRRMIVGDADKITPPQARAKARKLLATVELGGDPQGDRRKRREADADTLRSIIDGYFEAKAHLRPNSLRALRKYFGSSSYLGPLHSMPLDKITRRDIASRLLVVQKVNGAVSAHGLRGHLSALFSWAISSGLTESNPVIGSLRPPAAARRERVLSDMELATVWQTVGDMGDYGKVVRLIVLTGARREEIGAMAWSEFGDDGAWTLPASRSKNGTKHSLPITSMMQEILDSIPRRVGCDYLFRKRGFRDWTAAKGALDARLGLPKPWVLHDIRRSVASRMGDIGIMPHIIEEILNHQSGHRRGVAGIYNKSIYEREVLDAMVRRSDHVRALVEGSERRVLAFERAAAAL
jgi:integrase